MKVTFNYLNFKIIIRNYSAVPLIPLIVTFWGIVVSPEEPLTDDDSSIVSGAITLENMKTAVHQLPVSISPGPDELSGDFYGAFAFFFMSVPFLVFHYCLHVNSVTPSLANCETLIIAKRKDREKLRFYIDTDRSPWQMLTTKYSRKHCLIVCVLPRGD